MRSMWDCKIVKTSCRAMDGYKPALAYCWHHCVCLVFDGFALGSGSGLTGVIGVL